MVPPWHHGGRSLCLAGDVMTIFCLTVTLANQCQTHCKGRFEKELYKNLIKGGGRGYAQT